MQLARRAFYPLQGAGLGGNACRPGIIAPIHTTASRSVLTYGLECAVADPGGGGG